MQAAHGLLAIYDAAARGDDGLIALKAAHAVLFHLQKRIVADLIDDFLELLPLLLLQNDIRIDKIHLKGFCKQHADGAFAAARHTNQNNIRHRILLSTKNPCLFYPENHVFSREKAFFIKKQTVAAFAEGFFVENVDGGRWARANFA